MASPVPSLLALAGALATPALAQSPAPVSTTPRLTGYVQARFQSIGDSAVFFLRRVRLGAQGNLTPWASYRVQGELRSGGTGATPSTVAATDLYLALTHRLWTATIGQSKTPLSAEFLRPSTAPTVWYPGGSSSSAACGSSTRTTAWGRTGSRVTPARRSTSSRATT